MSAPGQSVEDELLARIFGLTDSDRVPTGTAGEKPAEDEEAHYQKALEANQDMKETEEAMVQAYEGIEKKKPGVWAIFRMNVKRTVDAQRGIERGLNRMGGQGKLPIIQLAALLAVTVIASSALSNKSLTAEVASSLASRTTQLEVLAFVGAVALVVVLLARSGRLNSGGKKR